MKSWLVKVVGAVALLFVGGVFVSQFYHRRSSQITETTPVIAAKSEAVAVPEVDAKAEVVANPEPAELREPGNQRQIATASSTPTNAISATEQNVTEAKTEQANPSLVSRERIEEYLRQHGRDGVNLLAAFHLASDPEHPQAGLDYLKEAAAKFPGDSRVQLAVLDQGAFPEERRKWLDAFKESSPGNSLANYLSAAGYFKDDQPDAAVKELLEASGKEQFADFAMESYLEAAELSRLDGASSLIANTAAASAVSQDLMPELSNMKAIAQGVLDLQKRYMSSGDTASVENLSLMVVYLADKLVIGSGGRFVISQMSGLAMESMALQSLNQSAAYDFLEGQTPAQRLEDIRLQRLEMEASAAGFASAFASGTEADRVSYVERLKIDGELSATRWLIQLHPPNSRPGEDSAERH